MATAEFTFNNKVYTFIKLSSFKVNYRKGQKKIPPSVEIDRKKEYEVEKILNKRNVRGKLKYFVGKLNTCGIVFVFSFLA